MFYRIAQVFERLFPYEYYIRHSIIAALMSVGLAAGYLLSNVEVTPRIVLSIFVIPILFYAVHELTQSWRRSRLKAFDWKGFLYPTLSQIFLLVHVELIVF